MQELRPRLFQNGPAIFFLGTSLCLLMGVADLDSVELRHARHLAQERRFEEAEEAYASALASGVCGPARRDAQFELGTCYQADRKWDLAISSYQRFLSELRVPEDDPDFVYGHWGLAECLFEKGSYRLALEAMLATHGHSTRSFCGTCRMLENARQRLRAV